MVRKSAKTGWKKCRKDLENRKMSLPLQPLWERNTPSKRKEKVLKNFWKFLQKDLEKRNSCLTFATAFASKTKARFWKKSLKNLAKRFGGLRKRFYLCTTFRFEKAVKQNEVFGPHRIRKCSYRDIRTAFFEVIEQQSFYPLERVISNNTFEIRAKDLTKLFFTMESLILAQDER